MIFSWNSILSEFSVELSFHEIFLHFLIFSRLLQNGPKGKSPYEVSFTKVSFLSSFHDFFSWNSRFFSRISGKMRLAKRPDWLISKGQLPRARDKQLRACQEKLEGKHFWNVLKQNFEKIWKYFFSFFFSTQRRQLAVLGDALNETSDLLKFNQLKVSYLLNLPKISLKIP